MNLLECAASGWGKSRLGQTLFRKNLSDYDRAILLDYKDEFRGLVSKKCGPAPCSYWMAGRIERDQWPTAKWDELLAKNPQLVLARNDEHLTNEQWREICATVIRRARSMDGSTLIGIDEAHFVAPERQGYPDSIQHLATTGRGRSTSAIWITQRPASLDKQIVGNCTARFLGGFEDGNTIDAFAKAINYPRDVHKSGGHPVPGLPDALCTDDGEAISVRKWTETVDGTKQTVNSEWIYSDDSGAQSRIESNRYDFVTDHVGAAGKDLTVEPE